MDLIFLQVHPEENRHRRDQLERVVDKRRVVRSDVVLLPVRGRLRLREGFSGSGTTIESHNRNFWIK